MKKASFLLLLFLCFACTGNLNPWGEKGDYQDQNQDSDPPEETDPTSSGVEVEDEITSEDNIDSTSFDGIITITYSNTDVTVDGSIKNITITKTGTRVTAENTGKKVAKYILTGSCNDGNFKIRSDKKQAIILRDLSLTNTQGAAINNQSKKRTFVVIEGTNTIADGAVNTDGDYPEETAEEDMKAAFFSEAQLIFSGTGNLTVNANGKAGITSDDYVRFMSGCNVTVNSSNGHGVRGKDAIYVSGGTINITVAASATGKKGFSTDSLMYFGGGTTSITNKASAGMVDGELTGASCIKADKSFVIQGGELTATASGSGCKCISGDENGFFEGGKITAKATGTNYGTSGNRYDSDNSITAKAIKFDGNLEFSGCEVTASASSHEAIESKGTIYISGGTLSATSKDDAINSGSDLTISDGVVYAYSTGNDGLDANGNMVIKGGLLFAIGTRDPEVGLDANTEAGYKLYIQGGDIIVIGGLERNSSVSQPIISTSWSTNTNYSLCNGSEVFFSFKTPSSGGSGLYLTSPSLVKGTTYSLKKSATVSGATSYFDGKLSKGGTASGGTSTNVTATTYSSGGNNPGGGGWR